MTTLPTHRSTSGSCWSGKDLALSRQEPVTSRKNPDESRQILEYRPKLVVNKAVDNLVDNLIIIAIK